ncbi:MAG: 2-haloacid dehalogenase [Rhodoferax sp.]|jgi:2-haloacid dehalogenase
MATANPTLCSSVKALLFDTFGSVVDWRGSLIRDLTRWGHETGFSTDWAAFADRWRGMYQPSMEQIRNGQRAWTLLDVLHRESLDVLISEFGLDAMTEAQRVYVNRVWHRLDGWPDAVGGLTRLKSKYIIAPLSNGNVSLLTDIAKYTGLPWDLNLSTEIFRCYKPQPQSYLGACSLLQLEPAEVMMCAAHNDDLLAARHGGLKTAFWPRPLEYGPNQIKDLAPSEDWDIVVTDIRDFARQMGV